MFWFLKLVQKQTKKKNKIDRPCLHTLFLENKAQIDKNNYGMRLFMSKQVSLSKISSILQKNENQPKKWSSPFLYESLQLYVGNNYVNHILWLIGWAVLHFLVIINETTFHPFFAYLALLYRRDCFWENTPLMNLGDILSIFHCEDVAYLTDIMLEP